MTIPVLYSFCQAHPEVRVIMVTRPFMCGMWVNKPSNLEVVGVDPKEKQFKGLTGNIRLGQTLFRRFHPDAYADMHSVLRSRIIGLVMRLHGVPCVSLYKDRKGRKNLVNGKSSRALTGQFRRYSEVLEKLTGNDFPLSFTDFYGGRGKAAVTDFKAITGPKPLGRKWIGIAPFAAHAGKVYPPELMRKLIELLVKKDDVDVFLFGGGAQEQKILDGWAAELPRTQSLAGKRYGFKAELALLNHLDCLVSMDSANMHLGALAGVPTLSIWGATDPRAGFSAWRQSPRNQLQAEMSCRPCSIFGNKPCTYGDFRCMRAISPEAVYEKILLLMENKEL